MLRCSNILRQRFSTLRSHDGTRQRRSHIRTHLVNHRVPLPSQLAFHRTDGPQRKQHQHGRNQRLNVEAHPARHPDRRHHKDRRRTGQPQHPVLGVQDQPGAKKTNSLHNVRRHLSVVRG